MKYAVIILRYIRGYVAVSAVGGFPERFLNLCYSGKINLWDVTLKGDTLLFSVIRSDFPRLRHIAKKSGVKIKIIKKTGLVYKYRRYHKRAGILSGIAVFLAVHLFLSMFVWCIEVKGNSKLSKTEILTMAEGYGLKQGTLKRGFDEIRTARSIAADYNGKITWLSVNIKGSLAVIELREDNRIITHTEDRPPCNIVADFDGVILSAETFCGDCMVKRGNGVKKGDLLINGAIVNEDTSTTFYASKGKITALHEKEINLNESLGKASEKLKIKDIKYRIGLFGAVFPSDVIQKDDSQQIFKERKHLTVNGYTLPFFTEKILICEKGEAESDTVSINALENIQNNIYRQNSSSTVTDKTEAVTVTDKAVIFSGKYTLIDFIGEEKPILSENSK
ncbi:MAG: sporulation protein YqfD [Clostridia bacterium]|nr:sporulation protein YqfD [Clostridia bacterium]